MKVEIGPYVKAEDLTPGTIYTQHDQAWWDNSLTSESMGVFLYMRTEYPIPEGWKESGAYLITVHQDEDGVEPSEEPHILDVEPEGDDGSDEAPPLDSTDPDYEGKGESQAPKGPRRISR